MMDTSNRISFRYSTFVIVQTIVASLILVVAFGAIFATVDVFSYDATSALIFWSAFALCLVSLGYFVAIAPRYYILDDRGIYIKRMIGGKLYSREAYTIEEGLPMSEISGAVRVFGSGGFCGYLGRFYVPRKGVC